MKVAVHRFLERYLLALARLVLARYRPVIIGITGSVGKTTTKDALYHVLHGLGLSISKTEGNLNADLGIALSILGYRESPAIWQWPIELIVVHLRFLALLIGWRRLTEYYIVEMGIDRLGDMARMLKTVKPTVGIITWIGEGHHLEYLKDSETVAKEKGLILSQLPKDGLAIIPATDPHVRLLEELATAPVVTIKPTGLDALPAIVEAIARFLKLDPDRARDRLTSFTNPKGRLTQLKGINRSVLIDDSYNASLPSAKLALSVLARTKGERKIAVFGDILEQGTYETAVHQEIAALAKEQVDQFWSVGNRFKKVVSDHWFATPEAAGQALRAVIQPGDVILVKGSQGMRMEKVSQLLAADPTEAKEKLPRQSKRWQQIEFQNP